MSTLNKITPIDFHIAQKLRQFRLLKGISQEKLGDLTGVTSQQIQKYERALNRIPASRLFEFSQILSRPVNDFFEDIEADRMYYNYDFQSDEGQRAEAREFDQEILPLIRAFKNIENNDVKKSLISLAASIAKPKQSRIKHYYS